MSSSSGCCCGAADPCTNCFYGRDADTLCCRLSDQDVLMYSNPRPASTKSFFFSFNDCDCTNEYVSLAYDALPDIRVRYNYEPGQTAEQTTGKWFYDNGSFGTVGSKGNPTDTNDTTRCALWPSSSSGCCADTSTGDASGNWWGPMKVNSCHNHSTSLGKLSTLQKDCILQGSDSPPDLTQNTIQSPCLPADPDGPKSMAYKRVCPCDGSDQYSWLLGIANDSSGEVFRHWYWNSAGTGSVVESTSLCRLSQTLVAVFHQEMWYRACEKYPYDITDTEAENPTQEEINSYRNGSLWKCRVPEWWVYGCSGIPVFSWEIGLMQENGIISSTEMTYFFQQISENKPIGETAVGNALLQKLMTKTWNTNAPTGVGILQTRDWAGYTKYDDSTVPDTERRIVRKDLSRWTQVGGSGTQTIEYDKFFYGRNGGWSHVCRYPCSGSVCEVDTIIPQVQRGAGWRGAGSECNAAGTLGSCLTAAPIPAGSFTCTGSSACGCDPCTMVDSYGNPSSPTSCYSGKGCTPGPAVGCGADGNSALCQQTTFAASCGGVHFQFNSYKAVPQPDALDPPFGCDQSTHAHLWILNRKCDESDDVKPLECQEPGCPSLAYDTFDSVTHGVDQNITGGVIRGQCPNEPDSTTLNTFCKGGIGVVELPGPEFCETRISRAKDEDNNSPGTAFVPAFGQDCGRYLCNEKGVNILGACCKTESGSTTCMDAVTTEQCNRCNEQAGVTAVWKGANSCCEEDTCS